MIKLFRSTHNINIQNSHQCRTKTWNIQRFYAISFTDPTYVTLMSQIPT